MHKYSFIFQKKPLISINGFFYVQTRDWNEYIH